MKMTLYTVGCPKCAVLEKKLASMGMEYETVTDKALMIEMGLETVPVLEVDGERMNFVAAVKWLVDIEKENKRK